MNTAIVHIDCATDSIPEVAEALAALPGISEVYSVAGNVDLIAIVRVAHFDEIARFTEATTQDGVRFSSMSYQTVLLRLAEQRSAHTAWVDYMAERYM